MSKKGDIGRGDDAKLPGMIEAFERHHGVSFTEQDFLLESITWAAAWKAAKAHQPKQDQDKPVLWSMPDGKIVDKWALQFYRGVEGIPLYTHPQPKQEQDKPVAVVTGVYGGRFIVEPTNSAMVLPVNIALYAQPQTRTWVGLTEEELQKILQKVSGQGWKPMLEAIEAKLKEKNT